MEIPNDLRSIAQVEDSRMQSAQLLSLKDYTRVRSASSNDCDWLHELLSSDMISAGEISPEYLVRVYYKEARDELTIGAKDFGTASGDRLHLNDFLDSKHVRAVILSYRDSSRVDPEILNLLWTTFKLEIAFMRHHFDYKGFRYEPGCPRRIRSLLEGEDDNVEDSWTFGGRWNPIRLPSETQASLLQLSVDSECLSVCHKSDVAIVLVRSKAVYREPQMRPRWRDDKPKQRSYPCNVDLFTATTDTPSRGHELLTISSESVRGIVHFYARLLVLRCYEDYVLRHDTQPILLDQTDRVCTIGHPHILAMHHRRLELVKLKQALSGYLGPLHPERESVTVCKGPDSAHDPYRRKLHGLIKDVEMLLSLYNNTMRIYESHIHETDSDYKSELASEQLAEAKESKATAISLGKLSNLAFLYLPLNFVCAMLGMNLSLFGQGVVPLWVFLALLVFFSFLTYLPIFIPRIPEGKVRIYKIAYRLAWRSISAGFWFFAFSLTHDYSQNFEIMNSGLAQEFLGYTGSRTKGWFEGRDDDFFERATWGSPGFWKEKVNKIFVTVEGLNSQNEPTELTV